MNSTKFVNALQYEILDEKETSQNVVKTTASFFYKLNVSKLRQYESMNAMSKKFWKNVEERAKAMETKLKAEEEKQEKQKEAKKQKQKQKKESTPVKVKKLGYKDYIKSPSGKEFPSSKTTAGTKMCQCTMSNVLANCARHTTWKRNFDEWISKSQPTPNP